MKLPALTIFSHISTVEKVLFTRHLAIMVKTGIPITEALETLMEQTKSGLFKRVIRTMLADVQNGKPLGTAMQKHPYIFSPLEVSLVEIGEEAGVLEDNLHFLTTQLEKDLSLKKKIQGALIYPAIVFSLTFFMSMGIAIFILPRVIDLFAGLDVKLPVTTRILLFVANLLKNHGFLISIGGIVLVVLTVLALRLRQVKPFAHQVLLHMPIVGTFIRNAQLAQLSRSLGTLIKSGVPINRSIDITARTLTNVIYQKSLYIAAKSISAGNSLTESLRPFSPRLYQVITIKMIQVGEKSGRLDETLLYLADYYEEEVENMSKNLSTLLEPALLIFLGVVVGFVALAILGPIYSLTGSLSR